MAEPEFTTQFHQCVSEVFRAYTSIRSKHQIHRFGFSSGHKLMRIDCLMWLKAVCQQGRNYLSIKLKEKPQLGNWLVGCIYIRYNMFHNICIYALVNGGCTTDPIHVYISSIYCKKVQIVERLCNDTIFIFNSFFFPFHILF